MGKKSVAMEFARRAKVFHPNDEPFSIKNWGLFSWGAISKLVKSGEVILNSGYSKENKTVWCRPSQAFYDKWVKPCMSYSANELQNSYINS
jgi:hypothetical protein